MKKILLRAAAALISALALYGCGPSKPVLHVYMWSDYISPEVVGQFEEKFGCRVIIDTFDSNEMLYAKMKAGGGGYDLLMPSSYMAKIMDDQGMVKKLDHARIPNLKFIDRDYLKNSAIDKAMAYSVPYMICYGCVAYDSSRIKDLPDTWAVFANPALKGRTTLLNDIRETIGAALKANGFSFNSTDDAELAKARDTILKWRENVAKFDNEAYKLGIATGEFALVHGYSGDLAQVLREKPNLKLMFPREGMSISCDDWVIPSDSKNPELAYEFINFVTSPEIAVQNMEFSSYDAPNWRAREIMPESMKSDPALNIPGAALEKSEVIMDLGEENAKYNKLWDEIKL